MKYLKIENDNITEIDEDIIKKELCSKYNQTVEMEQYCWNCEYFCPPQGCTGIFGNTVPFRICNKWSRASDEKIESIKKEINECCVIEPLRNMKKYAKELKIVRKDVNNIIDDIIELCDLDYGMEE